eukprot:m.183677 g.183677  ORF g.183677 m.183677 type:complete len:62 (+) comp32165_c1_seq4:1281-1466(+)
MVQFRAVNIMLKTRRSMMLKLPRPKTLAVMMIIKHGGGNDDGGGCGVVVLFNHDGNERYRR